MKKNIAMKQILTILIITVLIVIFQNWQTTTIHLLFWEIRLPLLLLLFVMTVCGGVCGYFFRKRL